MKERLKKVGSWLLDKILYFIGMFLFTLYVVVTDTIQGIFDFFVGAFFLYISWGIIMAVVAFIFILILKALGAH